MRAVALKPSQSSASPDHALSFWHAVVTRALAELPYDLSARQMGVLLTVYRREPPHSIKNLAECLHISKPAVCRAVDMLERMRLLKRVRDASDKRSVLLQRTNKGAAYVSSLTDIVLSTWSEGDLTDC